MRHRLLIRPHPSQDISLHQDWLKNKDSNVASIAKNEPLHDLILSSDLVITHTSTVGMESIFLRKKLLQIYYLGEAYCDMPYGYLGVAFLAETLTDIPKRIEQAFTDDAAWREIERNVATFLPKEKAAPKIASFIRKTANITD